MKKFIPLCICLLAGNLPAQDAGDIKDAKAVPPNAAPAPIEVVLELADGTKVTGTPAIDKLKLKTSYAEMDFQLSKLTAIEFDASSHEAHIKLQNGDALNGELDIKELALKTSSGDTTVALTKVSKIVVRAGSAGGDYVNSLGMEFVRVPKLDALFCIWDTRVEDYRAYVEANPRVDGKWKNAGFKQKDTEPVVNINWSEANAFCTWLTQKERAEGKITAQQEYRLPTDKEWSAAVGDHKFPWGDQWPPPKGAGNYAPDFKVDDFDKTSPVGSFAANEFGLYDMGGNVWQWCSDWYQWDMNDPAISGMYTWLKVDGGGKTYRVVRGASWSSGGDQAYLSSGYRDRGEPDRHRNNYGFRCVLAPVK